MSRRTKYIPEIINKIIKAIAEGRGRYNATLIGGIDYATFMQWLRRYPEFRQQVLEAEELGNDVNEDLCVRKILTAKEWQAGAWYLERTKPEKYGRRERVDIANLREKEILKIVKEEKDDEADT